MNSIDQTPAIFCPRNKKWKNSFKKTIKKLKKEHPFLVLTPVNIEQIKYCNCLPSSNGCDTPTGVIIEKNHIFSCSPFDGTEENFKQHYPDGIVWKKK